MVNRYALMPKPKLTFLKWLELANKGMLTAPKLISKKYCHIVVWQIQLATYNYYTQ